MLLTNLDVSIICRHKIGLTLLSPIFHLEHVWSRQDQQLIDITPNLWFSALCIIMMYIVSGNLYEAF